MYTRFRVSGLGEDLVGRGRVWSLWLPRLTDSLVDNLFLMTTHVGSSRASQQSNSETAARRTV